jgi:hypothetical protein
MPKTTREILAEKLDTARGKLSLLTIGIDDYSNTAFGSLKTCTNDAVAIRDIFSTTPELNADPKRFIEITTGGQRLPSRGEIISAIKEVAERAEKHDRVLVFFSGHGHRIGNKSYLVPKDVFSEDDPTAFIDVDQVLGILCKSLAKQKFLIIDACFCGPVLSEKSLKIKIKQPFIDYVDFVEGVVMISSSTSEQTSTTRSPDGKLSLFTYYLAEALKGNEEALDDLLLTDDSLYKYVSMKVMERSKSYQRLQAPSRYKKETGLLLIGNFESRFQPEQSAALEVPLTPQERLFADSMQKWCDFNIIPDTDTILALDNSVMFCDLPSSHIAFLYFSAFFRNKDMERVDGFVSFDHLFSTVAIKANVETSILQLVQPFITISVEWGISSTAIAYPKYLVARLTLQETAKKEAVYLFVRDSEGEGLEVLVMQDSTFTSMIRHINGGARDEQNKAHELLEKQSITTK